MKFVDHIDQEEILPVNNYRSSYQPAASECSNIRVVLNGIALNLNVFPVIKADTVYLPAFEILKAIGLEAKLRGAHAITIGGQEYELPDSVLMKNKTMFLPLDFFAQVCKCRVQWLEKSRTAVITTEDIAARPQERIPESYPRIQAFLLNQTGLTDEQKALLGYVDINHVSTWEGPWPFRPGIPTILHSVYFAVSKEAVSYFTDVQKELWPGHWNLLAGSRIGNDLSDNETQSVIQVSDTSLFSYEPSGSGVVDDVLIYALDDEGKPVWEHSEHATVTGIDPKGGTITVKRNTFPLGQYANQSRDFAAGKAVVAPHARTLLSQAGINKYWAVNLSLYSPADPQGRKGYEALSDILLSYFRRNPRFTGIEWDTGGWIGDAAGTNGKNRASDIDNDLVPDYRQVQEDDKFIPAWGLGAMLLSKRLAEGLGDRFIIQGDWGASIYNAWRGLVFGSGIEIEGNVTRISSGEDDVDQVQSGLELKSYFYRMKFASENSINPLKTSYHYVKAPTET
ncbi:MAG TPA: hypothetical protein DD727_08585, partial [Clostridiales bacterium]|nr:hypothetical protein [Clostridiales bacterium]